MATRKQTSKHTTEEVTAQVPEYTASSEAVDVNEVKVVALPQEVITEEKKFLEWIYQRLQALGDADDRDHMQTLRKIIDGK